MATALENSKLIAQKAGRGTASTVNGVTTITPPSNIEATGASNIPVDTSATDVKNQAPTSANIENARKNFESMDYQKQQDFLSKNKSFDVNKYGFKLASKPAEQIQPQGEVVVEDKKVDQNKIDTPERLQEIQTNLEGYYQTSKDLFKDEDTFNKFFQLDNRSQAQKDVLTKFYNNRKSERDLAALPTQQIASGLVNGLYTEDQLEFLKLSDPARYTEIQQAKIKESQKLTNQATLLAIAKQFGLGGDDDKNGTLDFMEKTTETPDITQTPEEKEANEQLNSLSNEIDDMQTTINGVEKELSKKYGGSVTKSQLAALVRDQTNGLIEDRNAKITEAKLLQGKIANFTAARELELKQYELDQNAFNQKLNLFNQAYGMYSGERAYELQEKQSETGKFSAIADGFGGITVFNTKTGEVNKTQQDSTNTSTSQQTNTSSGGTPRWSYTEKLGITQDAWNNATDAEKNTMLDKMYNAEGGNKGVGALVNRINNPAALTRPSSKEVQDYLISMGAEKRTNPNKVDGKNYSYAKFKTMEEGRKAMLGYINKFGLTTGGGKTSTPTQQANLGYNEQYTSYYQQNLDGKMDYKTAKLSGYQGTPEQFSKEAEAYRTRLDTALNSVGVDKDDFNLKVYASVAKVKEGLQTKTMDAIYNKIIKDPSLAKPENEGRLWTEVTGSQQPSKSLVDGISLLASKWKAVTDAEQNTRSNWAAYEGEEGTISNILPNLGVQPTGVVSDFISQRKAVGQIIAKLIENGRLSDSDRTFYQGLLPKLNTTTYKDGVNKLNNIRATFLGQGAPGTAGIQDNSDDGL